MRNIYCAGVHPWLEANLDYLVLVENDKGIRAVIASKATSFARIESN